MGASASRVAPPPRRARTPVRFSQDAACSSASFEDASSTHESADPDDEMLSNLVDETPEANHDTLCTFVREALVDDGHRVVCTSRLEGGVLPPFACPSPLSDPTSGSGGRSPNCGEFRIFELERLDEGQQDSIIHRRLEASPEARQRCSHICTLARLASLHDGLYMQRFSAEQRQAIEHFSMRDCFVTKAGRRDPTMRLKGPDGATGAQAIASVADVRSKHLMDLNGVLTDEALERLDTIREDVEGGELRGVVGMCLGRVHTARDTPSAVVRDRHIDVAVKLVQLVRKRRRLLRTKLSAAARSTKMLAALADTSLVAATSLVSTIELPSKPHRALPEPQLPPPPAVASRARAELAWPSKASDSDRAPSSRTWESKHRAALVAAAPHTTTAALWPCILKRCDQVYSGVEGLLTPFGQLVTALAAEAGVGGGGVQVATDLRDPVSVHDEAMDEYTLLEFDDPDSKSNPYSSGRFLEGRVFASKYGYKYGVGVAFLKPADATVAEANVADLLHARVVCPDGEAMLKVLELLKPGYKLLEGGRLIKASVVRCHNAFAARAGERDPLHCRHLRLCLLLEHRGRTCFCELRVEHAAISALHEAQQAAAHYAYFTSALHLAGGSSSITLPSSYPPAVNRSPATARGEMDLALDRCLTLYQEAAGTPLLLAMYLSVLKARSERPTNDAGLGWPLLPSDKLALHLEAIEASVFAAIVRTEPTLSRQADVGASQGHEEPGREQDEPAVELMMDGEAWATKEAELLSEASPSATHRLRELRAKRWAWKARRDEQERMQRQEAQRSEEEAMVPEVLDMLTSLALANTIDRRREFTSRNALEALADQSAQQELFERLASASPSSATPSSPSGQRQREASAAFACGIPLLQRLAGGDRYLARLDQGLFRFTHSALQHALTVRAQLVGTRGGNQSMTQPTWTASQVVNDPSLRALGECGEGTLGGVLAAPTADEWDFCGADAVDAVGARCLALLVGSNALLRRLRLEGRGAGAQGACVNVVKSLHANTALQSLSIYASGLGCEGSTALAEALALNHSLKDLCLADNGLGEDGAIALAAGLEANSTLRSLDVSYNALGGLGGARLAQTLRKGHNASLTELSLKSNGLDSEAGLAFADALESNRALRTLSLRGNRLGADGGRAIRSLGQALELNKQLASLDLSFNGIDGDDCTALAKSLRLNSGLTDLNLASNKVGMQGAEALGIALQINTTLKVLDLFEAGLGSEGGIEIADALRRRCSLASLSIRGNGLSAQAVEALRSCTDTVIVDLEEGEDELRDEGSSSEDEGGAKALTSRRQRVGQCIPGSLASTCSATRCNTAPHPNQGMGAVSASSEMSPVPMRPETSCGRTALEPKMMV